MDHTHDHGIWRRAALIWLSLLVVTPLAAQRIEFSWPTPNRAWEQGRGIEAYVQPTVSGLAESGLFGCVRSNGLQFHEGLDIKALRRDRRGEPTDEITAAMDGVVRYVNQRPGDSSYGRYVIVEHPDLKPAVFTLYAHLARVEPGLRAGQRVRRGQTIALMGRSAGGYAIPKDRAHLHFEIGLRFTDDFQAWFNWRRFGSPNTHEVWNGMNLVGIDPLDFLNEWKRGRVDNFQQYFDRMQSIVRLRVVTGEVPDFIRRYPALLAAPLQGPIGGWEVKCNSTGLPFSWTPLSLAEVAGQKSGTVQIVAVHASAEKSFRCKTLVKQVRGSPQPGSDLQTMLQLVFGLRR